MSGDIQTRQRRKEKRKSKKDEDVIVPGIDTAKYTEPTVLMHEGDHHGDHGVGWCAKIVFFALAAILAGLVVLIVLENRGGSDLDTPLSESRFSDYLQGWVDEVREEEHHSEPAFDDHDHDDDEDDDHNSILPNEPYPEEHDDSIPDETEEIEEELKAEINSITNAVDEDDNDDDDDDQSDEVPVVEEIIREKRQIVEEMDDDNDDDDDEMEQNMFDDNDNTPFEEEEDDDDSFEEIVDNDAGEDLLLQKIAQDEYQKQAEKDEQPEQESSSLAVKIGVGVLLAIVAHQIIIKKISATNDAAKKTEPISSYRGRAADVVEKIDTNIKEQKRPQNVEKEIEDQIEKEIVKISKATVEATVEPPKTTPLLYPEHYEMESIDNEEYDGETVDAEEYEDEEELDEEEIEYEEDEIESVGDEEEEEEDEIEEEISDIDDDDLMKRLEAKYGKIDDKNNNADDDADESWTKLPAGSGSQSYSDQLFDDNIPNETITKLYAKAKELEVLADSEKSNKQLRVAIDAYKQILEEHEPKINNKLFKEIAEQCIKRMRFIGAHLQAVDIHKMLINRFDDEPYYRNQLAISYLLINRLAEAKLILHEILLRWRYDGLALVHYGFVLKNLDLDYEDAAIYLQEGIDSNEEDTQDGRFYFALGDSLQRLGKNDEAMQVYRKGAELKLFLSEYQRSLYNVIGLKSRPFWTKVETKYKDNLVDITKYWQLIRDEGLKLLNQDGMFENEQENLRDVGDWKQFELFSRGMKTKNCKKAPFTCKLLEKFLPASTCKRGQVKFSVLHPETHVHSHCGPTNCRIRCHLGLKVPPKTFIRVANETRSWKDGEWLIFDDSFEHEVWNNGTSARLVLIVDVWHPDLTDEEKSSMSAI
ncbi:unnamed protein product [Diamesa serratosioi]